MSKLNIHNLEIEDKQVPFQDEIFQWPVAKFFNIDVWNLILEKYVTHPTDQQKLALVSPQLFGPLLHEKNCANLFGEVLDILHRNYYLTLTKKEFLSFRGLSKSCKKSIDAILVKNNPCFLHPKGIDHDIYDPRHVCWRSYLSHKELEERLWYYRSLTCNGQVKEALPISSLTIQQFKNAEDVKIPAILSTVGLHIYHLNIYAPDQGRHGPRWTFNRLQTVLGNVPNLISLTVDFGSTFCDEEDMKQSQSVHANPPPRLNSLNCLEVAICSSEISRALVANYASNLRSLRLNEISSSDYFRSLNLFSITNKLREISLSFDANQEMLTFLRENEKWPSSLESIGLNINVGRETGKQDFENLCTALLQQFGCGNHRLSTLNLKIYGNVYPEPTFLSSSTRMRLPFLRRLWIDSYRVCFNTIDFILGVRNSLEELVLTLQSIKPIQENAVELIWYAGYQKRMYESNIWEKMPKLYKLAIRTSSEEYSSTSKCYEYTRSVSDQLGYMNLSKELQALFSVK